MNEAMNLEMHPSVKKVAEFMTRNLPAVELQGVAEAIALIAPTLWGHYGKVSIQPLRLKERELTLGGDDEAPAN